EEGRVYLLLALLATHLGILGDLDLGGRRRRALDRDRAGERAAVGHGDRLVGGGAPGEGRRCHHGEGGEEESPSHPDLLGLGLLARTRAGARNAGGLLG